MANWDKFEIQNDNKVLVTPYGTDKKIEYDILKLQSGEYFLNKKIVFTNEAFEKIRKYTEKELKENSEYPIYKRVGTNKGDGPEAGITTRISSLDSLNNFIKEVEELEGRLI